MSLLTVEELTSGYGQIVVLHGISLTVEKGDLTVILGPAGHGKSTLLKTICGFVKAKSGSVRYRGQTISGLSTREIVEKGLAYIPERRHLFPEMTVEENLDLGASTRQARDLRKEGLDEVYSLFPILLPLRKRMAGSLSGGEGRMLAVARGLMSRAEFLAIDEPSQGLSPKLVGELFETIVRINQRGTTVLLVEQNSAHILQFATTVSIIEDGRVKFIGDRQEAERSELVRRAYLGS